MGWLNLLERRSLENPGTPLYDDASWEFTDNGAKTWSGNAVNAATALGNAAFFAGVRFISETIGSLPLRLMRHEDGKREPATTHPLYRVMTVAPNPLMSPMVFREILTSHMITWGNAYSEIKRNGRGDISELWPLLPDRTQKVTGKSGSVFYETTLPDGKVQRLPLSSVLHIPAFGYDGLTGYSVVTLARQGIGLALAAEESGGKFYGNGMRPSGILVHPNHISEEAQDRLRGQVTSQVGGLSKAQRLLILEEGLSYTQLGLPPGDAQFLETRQFQVIEIARWLNLPPHILKDLTNATYSNIEQQSLELVIHSLRPWFTRWEQHCALQLLRKDEQSKFQFKIEDRALLRGDTEQRSAYYQARFNTGSMTPNEIRELEDQNPMDGGDRAFIHSAYIPVDMVDEVLANKDDGTAVEPTEPNTELDGRDLLPLYRDAWERLIKAEMRWVAKIAPAEIGEYYRDGFVEFAYRTLRPVYDADQRGDLDTIIRSYARDAREELEDAPAEARSIMLANWLDRADTWAAA